jgi:hypothetical protein
MPILMLTGCRLLVSGFQLNTVYPTLPVNAGFNRCRNAGDQKQATNSQDKEHKDEQQKIRT